MFENSPSDRMQLVGMGDLTHPGCCMVCRSGVREEGYVRLGVYYDYEGEQYLCWTCLVQSAELIGCLIPSEVEVLRSVSQTIQAENVVLTEELGKANERLSHYDALLRPVLNDPGLTDLTDLGNDIVPASDESVTSGSENGSADPKESVEGSQPSVVKLPKRGDSKRRGSAVSL